jgi:hypothetical protein
LAWVCLQENRLGFRHIRYAECLLAPAAAKHRDKDECADNPHARLALRLNGELLRSVRAGRTAGSPRGAASMTRGAVTSTENVRLLLHFHFEVLA